MMYAAILLAITLVKADIIISDLSPGKRQVTSNGFVTLSARIAESDPTDFIRNVKFQLRADGNEFLEESVTNPTSPELYTLPVRGLSGGVEYCFEVEARNRFFSTTSSGFTCFSISDNESEQPTPNGIGSSIRDGINSFLSRNDSNQSAQQETQPTSNDVQYGLQADCFESQPGRFNICLDLSSPTGVVEDWMRAFTEARTQWQSAVTSNGVSISPAQYDAGFTATGAYPPAIDGLYIASKAEFIDGEGGVLGAAGPVYYKDVNGRRMATTGRMRFDFDDIQRLIQRGTFANLIEHEMAHVMGIGTAWSRNNIYTANSVKDNLYRGAAVNREWVAQGCQTVGGFAPIVETDGGPGTQFAHFDETCFEDEVMTGYVDAAGTTFSRFTVAALEDLGYSVNYSAAEPFSVSPRCCYGGGRRRLNDPTKEEEAKTKRSRRELSSRMMDIAQEFGREELGRLRIVREELRQRFGSFSAGDVEAADFVTVLVEEGGQIFDVIVTDEFDNDQ